MQCLVQGISDLGGFLDDKSKMVSKCCLWLYHGLKLPPQSKSSSFDKVRSSAKYIRI